MEESLPGVRLRCPGRSCLPLASHFLRARPGPRSHSTLYPRDGTSILYPRDGTSISRDGQLSLQVEISLTGTAPESTYMANSGSAVREIDPRRTVARRY